MADLVHNFDARKHKRGDIFKRVTDATPEVVDEASQQPTGEGSYVQVIVILDSLEMGFHGQSASETTLSTNLGEVSLAHVEVQDDIPSEQITSRPDKATSTRARCSRSLLLDCLLLNSYIPPQGQASPMEEVSALGQKVPSRLSIAGSRLMGANPWLPICTNCIRHYFR